MESSNYQTSTITSTTQGAQVQEQFYDNISSGGIRPTIIAIIIISIWLILEMGTFFGFLIPADLLLYTAWLILWANLRRWSAWALLLFAILATLAGDLLWYYRSSKAWAALFSKPDTWYFKRKHLYSAQAALEKYGDKIFYIGKFLHIRSFLPVLAWVGKMNIVRFWLNSLLSTLIRVWATFVPSFVIGVLFPDLINSWWMLVVWFTIFIGTEAVAWLVLFNKDLRNIANRIGDSHQHRDAIKHNLIDIKDHIGEVAEYVVKGENNSDNTDVPNIPNN